MRVFVTGATGFIGSAIVEELLRSGHRVLGLARSDAAAAKVLAAGAEVHRGDLEDLASLRRGAAEAEAIVHNGFVHDFTRFKEVCEIDRQAIEAFGEVVLGSPRPLVVTSGTALIAAGRMATEKDMPVLDAHAFPRVASEHAAAALARRGARVSTVRLSPSVHGEGDHGFVPMLIQMARDKGVSAYLGEGTNRWNAVHRRDAARLFVSAVEKAPAGAILHAVAEPQVVFRDLATAIGKHLKLPVEPRPAEHFAWFAHFAGLDCPASSAITQERFSWKPEGPTLLEDLERGKYF